MEWGGVARGPAYELWTIEIYWNRQLLPNKMA